MQKKFFMLCALILMSVVRADLYDGLSATPVEGRGVEVLLTRSDNDLLTTVMQVLALGRMAEGAVVYDVMRSGLVYFVPEATIEQVLEKAINTLKNFIRSPITMSELETAKGVLKEYLGIEEEELTFDLKQIYGWLKKAGKIRLRKAPAEGNLQLGAGGFQFSVQKEDRENIGKLIYAMSQYSYWQLLWKQKDVNALGDSVRHVPPLQFLTVCFGSEKLKGWMQNIHESTLKWRAFVNGLSGKITEERDSGRLYAELPGFAAILKKKEDRHALEQAAAHGDWNGFLEILLK